MQQERQQTIPEKIKNVVRKGGRKSVGTLFNALSTTTEAVGYGFAAGYTLRGVNEVFHNQFVDHLPIIPPPFPFLEGSSPILQTAVYIGAAGILWGIANYASLKATDPIAHEILYKTPIPYTGGREKMPYDIDIKDITKYQLKSAGSIALGTALNGAAKIASAASYAVAAGYTLLGLNQTLQAIDPFRQSRGGPYANEIIAHLPVTPPHFLDGQLPILQSFVYLGLASALWFAGNHLTLKVAAPRAHKLIYQDTSIPRKSSLVPSE